MTAPQTTRDGARSALRSAPVPVVPPNGGGEGGNDAADVFSRTGNPESAATGGGKPPPRPLTLPARGALLLIRGYQRLLSPILPPSCRFVPSCSQYGHEAIAKYGIIRGGALGAWRILRCNPFGGGGYDPVP